MERQIDTIKANASNRLYFLKQLRPAGLSSDHLLQYYKTVICPIVEYACPLWHSSISAEQCRSLESIQRRALRIIAPVITPYKDACLEFNIQTLNDRRHFISKKFYFQHSHPNGFLYLHLPNRQSNPIKATLRNAKQIPSFKTRTARFL